MNKNDLINIPKPHKPKPKRKPRGSGVDPVNPIKQKVKHRGSSGNPNPTTPKKDTRPYPRYIYHKFEKPSVVKKDKQFQIKKKNSLAKRFLSKTLKEKRKAFRQKMMSSSFGTKMQSMRDYMKSNFPSWEDILHPERKEIKEQDKRNEERLEYLVATVKVEALEAFGIYPEKAADYFYNHPELYTIFDDYEDFMSVIRRIDFGRG